MPESGGKSRRSHEFVTRHRSRLLAGCNLRSLEILASAISRRLRISGEFAARHPSVNLGH
jgi:hypothetical protein